MGATVSGSTAYEIPVFWSVYTEYPVYSTVPIQSVSYNVTVSDAACCTSGIEPGSTEFVVS